MTVSRLANHSVPSTAVSIQPQISWRSWIPADAWQVPKQDAMKYIVGYTCLNDVTARDIQAKHIFHSLPWMMAEASRSKALCFAACGSSLPACSLRSLRVMAAEYYAMNLNQCSIADMSRHPIFEAVPRRTLEDWSTKDRWVECRQKAQDKIRAKVENAMASKIAQMRSKQLQSMQGVFDDAMTQLIPQYVMKDGAQVQISGRPEVKSYEGLVNALTRLAHFLDQSRERLGEVIVPQMAADDSAHSSQMPVTPKLSEGEARAAAKMLIHMRQKAAAARQGEHVQAKTPKKLPPPKGRTLEGE